VAAVTGGAQGIGYACALRLAEEGVRCALLDVSGDRVADAARRLGAGHVGIAVDVTDASKVRAALDAAERSVGSVNVVVNSAGIAGPNRPSWEADVADVRRVMDVNFLGTWLVCSAAVPAMVQQGWGRIVNIASIAGKEGNPNLAAYSASKGAVIAYTKALGKELATKGVLVNCIAPAVIATEMNRDVTPEMLAYMLMKIPMGRLGQPAEVAELVAWLASERITFSTGAVYDISGGRATY
jgi:3-oxoacyl-[acyl-carrier protein] reductase